MNAPGLEHRAAYLILKLRLRRLWNRIVSGGLSRRKVEPGRTGTPPKTRRGGALTVVLGALMLLSYASVGWQAVLNIERALGTTEVEWSVLDEAEFGPRPAGDREPLPAAEGKLVPEGVLQGGALVLGLLFLAALLVSIANREFSREEWDLEWLVTLPVRLTALLRIRVLERTVLNVFGLLAILPFTCTLALYLRPRATSLLLAALVTACLLILLATIQTIVEAILRVSVAPARRRNLQAIFSIAGLVGLYLAMSVGLGAGQDPDYFVYGVARATAGWCSWLPTSIAATAMGSKAAVDAWLGYTLLGAEVVAVAALGLAWLERRLRSGIVSVGSRESGGRRGRAPASRARPRWRIAAWVSPVQRKELQLLGRDRSFLVQTLVLPVVIGGLQIAINPGLLEGAASAPAHLATFAFGITAYVLMFSAFQVLHAEGRALWILYTVPHRLESIVAAKAVLWGVLSLAYPAAILALALALTATDALRTAGAFIVVFAGIPIYAVIAACLGVLGSNPLDQDAHRRVRPRQAYLYMILASLYTYTIYAGSLWHRLVLVTLTALVALALWLKTRELLPYLLDPVSLPEPRASLAEGLIAVQIFFVIQALVVRAVEPVAGAGAGAGEGQVFAFALAGAVTYLGFQYYFWRRKVRDVPDWVGARPARSLGAGLSVGAAALVLGGLVSQLGGAPAGGLARGAGALSDRLWLVSLGVLVAPFFEEFLFRGLLFRGLRQFLPRAPAMLAGAAIFAMAHPAGLAAEAFLLGLGACWAQERSQGYLAPFLVHALYAAGRLGVPIVLA